MFMFLKWYERYAWLIFIALGFITVSQTAFIFYRALEDIAVLAGYAYLGFGLITFGISFKSYSIGRKWAWYAMWYVPTIYLIATYQHMILGIEWQAFAVPFILSLVALLLPYRRFFPKAHLDLKTLRMMPLTQSPRIEWDTGVVAGNLVRLTTPRGSLGSLKVSELHHRS